MDVGIVCRIGMPLTQLEDKVIKVKSESTHIVKGNDVIKQVGNDKIELPVERKLLPCKWVFRYKYVSDSNISKYEPRLATNGFKQEHGVDYDEIFSLVIKMTTLRLLLGGRGD